MDRTSLAGLTLGLAALIATQVLEGGHLSSLVQGPAAAIVTLGTFGATLLSCSESQLRATRGALASVFVPPSDRRAILPTRFRDLARVARKDGLVALDNAHNALPTPFMRRGLRHVIDGVEEGQLREVLEADTRARSANAEGAATVLEVAGGYAPTMGILGAVLGLVRALESLADPEALGAGIAIAFVATIYGVGAANLLLLPLASKIRERIRQQEQEDEMVIDGILGLQAGISPRAIERGLLAHLVREEE